MSVFEANGLLDSQKDDVKKYPMIKLQNGRESDDQGALKDW